MIAIRTANLSDRDFVVDTARRFAAFGPPPWRAPHEVVEGEVRCLDAFFDGGMQEASLLIAEVSGAAAGFAFLEHATDYFSGDRHAHLGMIAVGQAAEGQGVATALLRAAEEWARLEGYGKLTLNVFEGNSRARRLYERAGYEIETLKYVKTLE